MSVKAAITHVKVVSTPVYLGVRSGTDSFSANPDTVMNWLCDGWRTRFNQHRSNRRKFITVDHPDGSTSVHDVPLGGRATTLRDTQARKEFSYLSALPSLVIQTTERQENTTWFAALARRSTLAKKGKPAGAMPGFRSRKRDDQIFVCFHNNGRAATFQRTGRRTGVVTLRGRNPVAHTKHKSRSWTILIKIRTRQDIGEYTSVQVNWTTKQITFTSPAKKIALEPTASTEILGIDRGKCYGTANAWEENHPSHPASRAWSLEHEELFEVPEQLESDQTKINTLQRKLGRMRSRAKKSGISAKQLRSSSRRYRDLLAELNKVYKHQAAVRKDWLHQITSYLAARHTVIAVEMLPVKDMTAKGGRRKARMNRPFLRAAPSMMVTMLDYKHSGELYQVPRAYTSQRCHSCGFTSRKNRKSQAEFNCLRCGHTANADLNAASNIALVAHHCLTDPADPAGSGAVATASSDGHMVVIPRLSTESFTELYQSVTMVDLLNARQTPRNAAVVCS